MTPVEPGRCALSFRMRSALAKENPRREIFFRRFQLTRADVAQNVAPQVTAARSAAEYVEEHSSASGRGRD